MKDIKHKKMLKEACVLLIATVMVFSTVAVSADTNNESSTFMLVGADYISQSQTNMFDPDWIHFDDGTNVACIGVRYGGTFEFGIRITPTELVGYDAWEITTVKWHHGMVGTPQPSHSGRIKIYDAGTSTKPGSLITSETFTTAASSDWEETVLSNPVTINASKDIWVTIQVTHGPDEYPAGAGPGPMVPGKGGWITRDGVTWDQIGDLGIDYNWNIWAKVAVGSPSPEKPQQPVGPTEGVVGVEYTFSTSTTDPEGEQVSYWWDWDDGTPGEWTDLYDSGETVYASHIWNASGYYNITVKARDPHEKESEWSESLMINIVDTAILEISNITGGLFKITAVIKNIGGADATMVDWSIILDGGFILLGKETSDSIVNIPAGDEVTISSGLIFGFGKTVVTVTAECAEGSSDTKTQDAFVLLFFIKI